MPPRGAERVVPAGRDATCGPQRSRAAAPGAGLRSAPAVLPPGTVSLSRLQRLAGNRAVATVLVRQAGGPAAPVVQRAAGLPFDSHTEIHHNVLTSREFRLASGEGVIVELKPEWYAEDDTEDREDRSPVPHSGEGAPRGLGGDVRVTLENLEWLDERKGRCSAGVGRWNELALRTDEDGAHQLVLDIDDHNPHFYVDGPIHVRQGEAAELTDSCPVPASRSGKEILHDVLALAGMIPLVPRVEDARYRPSGDRVDQRHPRRGQDDDRAAGAAPAGGRARARCGEGRRDAHGHHPRAARARGPADRPGP